MFSIREGKTGITTDEMYMHMRNCVSHISTQCMRHTIVNRENYIRQNNFVQPIFQAFAKY